MRLLTSVGGALFVCVASWSCGDESPTAPTPGPSTCTFQLASSAQTFNSESNQVTVNVTTGAQCAWTARVEADWLTITAGASGTGPGTVSLMVAANVGEGAREASITVADQSVRLRQDGRTRCEFALSPETQRFGPEGGPRTVELTTGATCSWNVVVSDSWLTVSPLSGAGSATLSYLVQPSAQIPERSATITVADRKLIVRQGGDLRLCKYSVTPVDVGVHWHGMAGEVQLVTEAGCSWTAHAAAGWVDLVQGTSGEGNGRILFTVGEFTLESVRRAPIEIRWPAESEGQNVWITQEGCRYAIAGEKSKTFPASGGRAEAYVIEQPMTIGCNTECRWTAEPAVTWIRVLSGSPNQGYDRFTYEVLPNTTGSTRTGAINIMGQTLSVIQTPNS